MNRGLSWRFGRGFLKYTLWNRIGNIERILFCLWCWFWDWNPPRASNVEFLTLSYDTMISSLRVTQKDFPISGILHSRSLWWLVAFGYLFMMLVHARILQHEKELCVRVVTHWRNKSYMIFRGITCKAHSNLYFGPLSCSLEQTSDALSQLGMTFFNKKQKEGVKTLISHIKRVGIELFLIVCRSTWDSSFLGVVS